MVAVPPLGLRNTTPGVLSDREAWREGYDAGRKHGVAQCLNSPVVEQIALELAVTRAALRAVSDEAAKAEKRAAHWHTQYLAMIREKLK